MKLTIFPSGPGDCLLLTGADGKRVLIDGGERYRDVVAPRLADTEIDVVYVSHDDGDHIKGVLQLFEDMKKWILFKFQEQRNNTRAKQPEVPRPPKVTSVWHNAFHDLLPEDFRPTFEAVSRALSIMSAIPKERRDEAEASGSSAEGPRITMSDVVENHQFFVTSQRQSHELSRLVGKNLLKIEVNPKTTGKLMTTETFKSVDLGGMKFRLLGPRPDDIEKLRKIYKEFLEENQSLLDDIRRKTSQGERLFRTGDFTDVAAHLLEQASTFGRRSKVTPPNHASMMFWVQEGDERAMLLTGDGHHAAILESLQEQGLLPEGDEGHLHVPLLKVPHHGSEHNVDENFCRRITADHYVFCGNGAHHNPDLRIVELFVRQRAASPHAPKHSQNPQFRLWFSAHHTTANTKARKSHMKKVEEKIAELKDDQRIGDLFEATFLTRQNIKEGVFPEIEI